MVLDRTNPILFLVYIISQNTKLSKEHFDFFLLWKKEKAVVAKPVAKKAPAKKAVAVKPVAKKAPAKKAVVAKPVAKKAPAKKACAKKK